VLGKFKFGKFCLIAGAALGALAVGTPANAAGVQAGVLSCNVASGWGFIFGSSREVKCTFSGTAGGPIEHYAGHIGKFGVDIGYMQSAVIVWAVIAPTTQLAPGALAGGYGGVTGGAAVGVGAGANVLIGGSNKSISLQPVSIEGNSGLNVAAGIAELRLDYKPNVK
jgi:hypothetical protein